MIRALLFVILLAPVAAHAQIPDVKATPHQLRTMTPAQLGALLFGAGTAPFTDAWVQGPTRDFRAITIDLATTPQESGYDGLCQLTTASTYFLWTDRPDAEDSPLEVGTSQHTRTVYMLTSDRPALTRVVSQGRCGKRKPLSSYPIPPTIMHAWDFTGPENDQDATPAAVRFGLLAIRAAQSFAETGGVKIERCTSGFIDVPASCGDPAAFVRSIYFRQIESLVLARCEGRDAICVDAAVTGLGGGGIDHIIVDTGETVVNAEAGHIITAKAVTVRAGSDPIID